MPEISRFCGIIIAMYHNDHPPLHFHVCYGQQKPSLTSNPSPFWKENFPPEWWDSLLNGQRLIAPASKIII